MQQKKNILKSQRGFSLIEIMIVVSLLAVIGTFVVGQLTSRLDEGNYNSAKIQIGQLKTMMEEYRRYCSQYPTTEQGLEALAVKPSSAPECPNYPTSAIIGGGKIPLDPWGRAYLYESDGRSFVITSLGKDGAENGEEFDKDIKSNEL